MMMWVDACVFRCTGGENNGHGGEEAGPPPAQQQETRPTASTYRITVALVKTLNSITPSYRAKGKARQAEMSNHTHTRISLGLTVYPNIDHTNQEQK